MKESLFYKLIKYVLLVNLAFVGYILISNEQIIWEYKIVMPFVYADDFFDDFKLYSPLLVPLLVTVLWWRPSYWGGFILQAIFFAEVLRLAGQLLGFVYLAMFGSGAALAKYEYGPSAVIILLLGMVILIICFRRNKEIFFANGKEAPAWAEILISALILVFTLSYIPQVEHAGRLAIHNWKRNDNVISLQANVNRVAISPDGRYIAVSYSSDSHYDKVTLWDNQKGAAIYTFQNPQGVGPLTFSPDGKYLLCGTTSSEDLNSKLGINIWDIATGKPSHILMSDATAHKTRLVDDLLFSIEGTYLAVYVVESENRYVELWDFKTGKVKEKVENYPGSIGMYTIADNAFKTAENKINLIIKENYDQMYVTRVFTPDGKWLIVGRNYPDWQSGYLRYIPVIDVWDVTQSEKIHTIQWEGQRNINEVAVDRSGRYIAVSNGRLIDLLDGRTGKYVMTLREHPGSIKTLVFASTGKYLISAGDQYLKIWGLE